MYYVLTNVSYNFKGILFSFTCSFRFKYDLQILVNQTQINIAQINCLYVKQLIKVFDAQTKKEVLVYIFNFL